MLYTVQKPDSPPGNLRGIFRTREDGSFAFLGVRPTDYPIPADGPVGKLLASTGRHPWRPAHIHVIVSATGYQSVATHIFDAESTYLASDAVFAVKASLVRAFERHEPGPGAPDGVDVTDRRTIELGDCPARSAQEDVGQGAELVVVGSIVDIEDHLPWCARLHPVVVADREHRAEIGEVDVARIAFLNLPGQGAEALAEARWPAWAAPHGATRADRLAVTPLEVRAPDPPVRWREVPRHRHMRPMVPAGVLA